MRVVIAGGVEAERRTLTALLQAAGAVVAVGADIRSVAPLLMQGAVDVLVAIGDEGGGPPRELIRLAEELLTTAMPYVFVLGNEGPESWWLESYAAGADGELRRSSSKEYWAKRVFDAGKRRLQRGKKPAPVAVESATLRSATELVRRLLPWRFASELLRIDTSKYLGAPATLSTEPEANAAPLAFAYTIGLACPLHQLEMRIALGADAPSGLLLANALFGEESDELAGDLLSELANIMMGALKSGFSEEGLAFTGGLPRVIPPATVLAPPQAYTLVQTCAIAVGGAKVHVHLGIESKGTLTVTAAFLAEGMVLVRDLFNPKGLLLIAAGTRLSTHMVERVRGVLPPKQEIDVLVA